MPRSAQFHEARALSLNPNNDLILVQNGELLTWLGRPQDGIEWILKHALLAASLAQLGDRTAASAHAQEVLKHPPEFSTQRHLPTLHYRLDSDREHLREGLQKAGLPA
jgi:adenylate cyclase